MSKASLLELCHGVKKYETLSISENNENKTSIAPYSAGQLFHSPWQRLGCTDTNHNAPFMGNSK